MARGPAKRDNFSFLLYYILVDKQPAKRFVEDADCRKIYGAVATAY